MRWTTFEGMRLLTLPGVFTPTRSDTQLLWDSVEAAGLPLAGRVLEVCAGSGALALAAARAGGAVATVDVSRRAVWSTRLNAARLRLAVDARRGDLFEPVAAERFDLVVSNPPYVPLPARPRGRAARSWDGGDDGRALLDRLCRGVADVLAPGGTVAIVHSSLANLGRTEALLGEQGLHVHRLAEREGPLGPIGRRHRDHLRRLGVIDDRETEVMAVVAGTAPLAVQERPFTCGRCRAA